MRKGAKWFIALLVVALLVLFVYPTVAGWFVMM